MIRMYSQTADQILIALLYARDRVGLGSRFQVLRDWALNAARGQNTNPLEPELQQTVIRILERNELSPTLTEVVLQLGAQIDVEMAPIVGGHDKDLIDTVVRTLQLSFLKNRLTSENLQRLRAAILLPAEQAALRNQLQNEMACTGCGHKFHHGEMGSFLNESGNGVKLVCTNCYSPEWVACTESVKHSVPAPSGMRKMFSKQSSKCEMCAEDKAANETPTTSGIAGGVYTVTGAGDRDVRDSFARYVQTHPISAGAGAGVPINPDPNRVTFSPMVDEQAAPPTDGTMRYHAAAGRFISSDPPWTPRRTLIPPAPTNLYDDTAAPAMITSRLPTDEEIARARESVSNWARNLGTNPGMMIDGITAVQEQLLTDAAQPYRGLEQPLYALENLIDDDDDHEDHEAEALLDNDYDDDDNDRDTHDDDDDDGDNDEREEDL